MLASSTGRRWLCLAALLAVASTVAGCAANKELQPDGALNGNGKYGAATPGSQRDFSQNVGDIVYFSTDQTDLSPEAQQTLAKQSQWLQQYPQYTITIEGHADERGTREYNIALGAKRATSVRNFLSSRGINASRVLNCYGAETLAILPVGGENGSKMTELLKEIGFPTVVVPVRSETRTNMTISDKQGLTIKLNEVGGPIEETCHEGCYVGAVCRHVVVACRAGSTVDGVDIPS